MRLIMAFPSLGQQPRNLLYKQALTVAIQLPSLCFEQVRSDRTVQESRRNCCTFNHCVAPSRSSRQGVARVPVELSLHHIRVEPPTDEHQGRRR